MFFVRNSKDYNYRDAIRVYCIFLENTNTESFSSSVNPSCTQMICYVFLIHNIKILSIIINNHLVGFVDLLFETGERHFRSSTFVLARVHYLRAISRLKAEKIEQKKIQVHDGCKIRVNICSFADDLDDIFSTERQALGQIITDSTTISRRFLTGDLACDILKI